MIHANKNDAVSLQRIATTEDGFLQQKNTGTECVVTQKKEDRYVNREGRSGSGIIIVKMIGVLKRRLSDNCITNYQND